MKEILIDQVVTSHSLFIQNLHLQRGITKSENLDDYIGFPLNSVVTRSADQIYESLYGDDSLTANVLESRPEVFEPFRSFMDRLYVAVLDGHQDRSLNTRDALWVIRKGSNNLEPYALTFSDAFSLRDDYAKEEGIFSSKSISELKAFPRNPTLDWIVMNVLITSWLTVFTRRALDTLYGFRLEWGISTVSHRRASNSKFSRFLSLGIALWLIGQTLLIFASVLVLASSEFALDNLWKTFKSLFSYSVPWFFITFFPFILLDSGIASLILRLKRKEHSAQWVEKTKIFLLNLKKPLLHRNSVEDDCRRYIAEIVKFKSLTEDFDNLDLGQILGQWTHLKESYPQTLLQLNVKQYFKAVSKSANEKSGRLRLQNASEVKNWLSDLEYQFPQAEIEGHLLIDFLILRAMQSFKSDQKNANAWEVELPIMVSAIEKL